jgi:hypothetical protein
MYGSLRAVHGDERPLLHDDGIVPAVADHVVKQPIQVVTHRYVSIQL